MNPIQVKLQSLQDKKQELSERASSLIKRLDCFLYPEGRELIIRIDTPEHIDLVNRFDNYCKQIDRLTCEISWLKSILRVPNFTPDTDDTQILKQRLKKRIRRTALINGTYRKRNLKRNDFNQNKDNNFNQDSGTNFKSID